MLFRCISRGGVRGALLRLDLWGLGPAESVSYAVRVTPPLLLRHKHATEERGALEVIASAQKHHISQVLANYWTEPGLWSWINQSSETALSAYLEWSKKINMSEK